MFSEHPAEEKHRETCFSKGKENKHYIIVCVQHTYKTLLLICRQTVLLLIKENILLQRNII